MTTIVKVTAGKDTEVEVFGYNPADDTLLWREDLEPGAEKGFVAHHTQEIRIRETGQIDTPETRTR